MSMTMTASAPTLAESCPRWCRSHQREHAQIRGGGVTALHESDVVVWSEQDNFIAAIRRIDEYGDGHLDGIYLGDGWDFVWDISADQARRLAAALVELADQLDNEPSDSADSARAVAQ
jgi:hypothetical protein